MRRKFLVFCCAVALLLHAGRAGAQTSPVLFVTQVPVGGFTVVTSTFGNHLANPDEAPRGGDLVLRYPDGTLRFLTQEAGYGSSGMQGAGAIAVREPCVHWSGDQALFAMIVGAPTQQYQVGTYHWRIYEVSGLAAGATATIRKIAHQPAGFNNVSCQDRGDDTSRPGTPRRIVPSCGRRPIGSRPGHAARVSMT